MRWQGLLNVFNVGFYMRIYQSACLKSKALSHRFYHTCKTLKTLISRNLYFVTWSRYLLLHLNLFAVKSNIFNKLFYPSRIIRWGSKTIYNKCSCHLESSSFSFDNCKFFSCIQFAVVRR